MIRLVKLTGAHDNKPTWVNPETVSAITEGTVPTQVAVIKATMIYCNACRVDVKEPALRVVEMLLGLVNV